MNPLDQPATAGRLRWLASQGLLDQATLERALAAAGALPTPRAWSRFLGATLLVLGAVLAVAGIFFFFAYNWDGLHRFVKLGLLAGAVALAGGFAVWRDLERLEGQVASSGVTFCFEVDRKPSIGMMCVPTRISRKERHPCPPQPAMIA